MRFAPAASGLLLAVIAGGWASAELDVAGVMERVEPQTKQCSGGDECRTAAQAAPYLMDSFRAHNISCVQEAACLVSLILLESGSLRYKHNVSPGVLGQGTANMQSPKFNFGSAAWFHETQCSDQGAKAKLRDNGFEGCGAYLKECVGTGQDDPQRVALNENVYREMKVDSVQKCVPLWEC